MSFFVCAVHIQGKSVDSSRLQKVWDKMQQCSLLTRPSIQGDVQVRKMTFLEVKSLLKALEVTAFGGSYASIVKKYMMLKKNNLLQPLTFFVLNEEVNTVAEFYAPGEINIKQSALNRIISHLKSSKFKVINAQVAIDLSFVIHEITHAISYYLHKQGKFNVYFPHSKIDEALAYYAQGFFLKELQSVYWVKKENLKTPNWDKCKLALLDIYFFLGVSSLKNHKKANEILFDLQFEAMESPYIPEEPFITLTYMYENFFQPHSTYWTYESMKPFRIVTYITKLISEEIDSLECKLTKTFDYMEKNILLYAPLPELPLGVKPCRYFYHFSIGLLGALEKQGRTSNNILFWQTKKRFYH